MRDKQIKILLVEDNPGDGRLIRDMMGEAKDVVYKIECVGRLDEGLKRLAEGGIELLLLDLGLPDSQGIDTLVKVYSQDREVPIIVLTGLEDEKLGLNAVQKGAQDYLVKGQVDIKTLNRALHYAVERKKMEKKIEHLNSMLWAIHKVNRLISKEKDRRRILQGVCSILVKVRGYYNAWVALIDEPRKIVWTAGAGLGKHFFPISELMKNGVLPECAKKALSQSGVVAVENPLSNCVECPLPDKYKERAAMVVRLEHGGRVYGLLTVQVPSDLARDDEEQNLFEEIAGDISFALNKIELEEERKQAEERYQDLVEKERDIIYALDDKGNIMFCNPAVKTILGYGQKELIGENFMFLIPKELQEKARDDFNKLLKKGVLTAETILMDKKGRHHFVEYSSTTIKDDGSVVGVRGIIRDITERKQAEEALKESGERYRELVEKAGIAILEDDEEGNIIYANKKAAELYGYTLKEIKKQSIQSIVHPDDFKMVTKFHKARVKGKWAPSSYVFRGVKKDRSIRYLELEAAPHKKRDRIIGTRLYIKDITARKQVEEALKERTHDLSERIKEKEVLLQEIHHRVKNNMQIISSLINLQSRHIKDEKALDLFKSTRNRVQSMAVIHERLYKSKDFAKVNIAEYVQGLIVHLFSTYGVDPKSVKLNVKIKNISLDINTAIPCGLIINELVSNSLKHAFPEGKKGKIKIAMQSLNKNEFELLVSDDGVGLPENVDIKDKKSLGLHLTTILAEDQLHGEVKLDRTKGTHFHIRFKA